MRCYSQTDSGARCYIMAQEVQGNAKRMQKGKGYGVVGDEDFGERVQGRFLKAIRESREVPGVRGIIGQIAPAKILVVVSKETGIKGEDLKKKGGRGIGRGLLMEMLYRYGGLNQREIGEMMGVDYSSVSVARRPQSHLMHRNRDNLEKIFLGRYFI